MYVLKNHFGLWVIAVLGIVGTLVSVTSYALLNQNKTHGTHDLGAKGSVPQITTRWDYRPKDVTRRDATVTADEAAQPTHSAGSSSSVPNENADVWFNFANLELSREETTTEPPL
jgi:hypothetical protein